MKSLFFSLILIVLFSTVSYPQSGSITQWKYGNLTFYYVSGLMDLTSSSDSLTVFLTNQEINCSTITIDPHDIGGAWIEIKFPDLTVRDYAVGEFWATMSCWVVGPYYGSCQGYLGTAGITAIDTMEQRIHGWINFETDVLGYIVSASGTFDVPYCAPTINSLPQLTDTDILNSPHLYQNYPNPFNPFTFIEFTLPGTEFVELKVFNILGKEVTMLVSKILNPGYHAYTFDGKNLASGVYYYQLDAGDYREVKKMILLR